MRALVIESSRQLTLRDVPRPSAEGECLIRVSCAGICGTDLQLLAGYADYTGIPGHEFVGVVEDAPAGDAHWIGKRVVGEINVGCGACVWCARRVKEHCIHRTVMGIRGRSGAFAEYVTLPASNLHEVPASLDDETAVFVEPVAAACRILEQVEMSATTSAAILGDGRLGMLTAQVLRTRGSQVTLLGRHPRKLAIARSMGLDAREHVPGERFDLVVDATGAAQGVSRAIELVEPRGIVVLKSTVHGEAGSGLWPVAVHEISIVGSRCGPFAPALALLQSGRVLTSPLVAQRHTLGDYDAAFVAARTELKVLLYPT